MSDGLHVSGEHLMHFRCGSFACRQWWSIADWDAALAGWPQPYICCPRCGRSQQLPSVVLGQPPDDVLAA